MKNILIICLLLSMTTACSKEDVTNVYGNTKPYTSTTKPEENKDIGELNLPEILLPAFAYEVKFIKPQMSCNLSYESFSDDRNVKSENLFVVLKDDYFLFSDGLRYTVSFAKNDLGLKELACSIPNGRYLFKGERSNMLEVLKSLLAE